MGSTNVRTLEPLPTGTALSRRLVPDDIAYLLPMAVWLVFTWAGGYWPSFYVASYVLKVFLTTIPLILFRRQYTRIVWTHLWLGVALGIIGVFQWVCMEKGLLHLWPNYPRLSAPVLDPMAAFSSPSGRLSFIAIRWAGASLVVPFMEELFWRDFLWRTIAAPADFKLAKIGEWESGIPLILVTLLFCSVHVEWMTAIVWGLMIGGLLIYTRSLGACIVMHATTNFLLGAYVLYSHDWRFW
jgi:CAAX prenyl protease-like protein